MIKLLFGVLLALVSSGLFAAGYIGQHQAITRAPMLSLKKPLKALRQLASNRMWLIAYGGGLLGWVFYIAALCFAPLSLVQVLSAGSIGTIAFVSRWSFVKDRPNSESTREPQFAVLAVVGIALVLGCMRWIYQPKDPSTISVVAFVVTSLSCALLLAIGSKGRPQGAVLGVISGLCYGAGDIATKGAVEGKYFFIPIFVACAALGFVTLQLSYQRASLFASAGLSALATNALPILGGVVVFHESDVHGVDLWLQTIGFVLVLISAVGLAVTQSGPFDVEKAQQH